MTAGSRMVFSHARDRGFARLSEPLGRVHPRLKVPVWSVLFTATWVVIFGLVFLGSDVALNAILSASVCFLQVSYLIPSEPPSQSLRLAHCADVLTRSAPR
jgi:choline transport protein